MPLEDREKHWHVYIVRCHDGSLYAGIAKNLEERLAAHNSGKRGAKYTRSRRPVRLVYCEWAESRSAAAKREYQLKKMPLEKKRELIIAGAAAEWSADKLK
ncbi:MAG: GIY-YIG nuclease family protein [Deltaproteobacteria bacterium]|nr:GIY-YIG nuclease family protein [Deltaproteobacteria bacterium]